MKKEYELFQSPFYKLSSKRKLEEILSLKKYELNRVDSFLEYRVFEEPKKNGGTREITAPGRKLKAVQGRLFSLLSRITKPTYLISGCKGKSYVDNAKLHNENGIKYAVTIDIEKFYPNCTREQVFKLFHLGFLMPKDVAKVCCDILTHNNEIPTGSPASQTLAFLAYKEMFDELNTLAENSNCTFSVYVDDLTFSSKNPINTPRLIKDVQIILHKFGHKLNAKKIKKYGKNDYKLITGVVITQRNELKTPNNLLQKIKDDKEIFLAVSDKAEEKEVIRRSLFGRIICAKNIEKNSYPELIKIVNPNY